MFALLLEKYIGEVVFLTYEMAPYLLLGFLFAGLLNTLFSRETVERFLGGNSLLSVVNASLLGVPLPLCSCGVVPTAVSFHRHGASRASTVSFLISTPQTGVDSMLVTYSFFGWFMTLLRPLIAFFAGILGGMLTILLERNKPEADTDPWVATASCSTCDSCLPAKPRGRIQQIFYYGFVEFLQDLSKWFVIGILVAALIGILIPQDFFASYIKNDFLGMLIALAVSVPAYVCATASVPIAAVLMMKGISPGAAVVFLMAGPATNAATITVLGKTLGRRALFAYLGSIIFCALLFGLLIDNLLPREYFTAYLPHDMGVNHADHDMMPLWFKQLSSLTLVALMLHAQLRKKLAVIAAQKAAALIKQGDDEHFAKVRVRIEGMTCNHCKKAVESGLLGLEGIHTVRVDVSSNEAIIAGEIINLDVIRDTVVGLGYVYAGVISSKK